MTTTNFRIGNLVEEPKGCTHKIERVDELSNRVRHGIKISIPHLTGFGFVKDDNGNYWINLQTHYLELMPSNGYWHPTYAQVPEMSHEEEQRVSTNRIEFVHELQNLFFALTGTELEIMEELKKENEKTFAIHNVSNSTLLEVFEDAVCDRNYNPTSDKYNKSGYTYAELKAEIFDRLQSERA